MKKPLLLSSLFLFIFGISLNGIFFNSSKIIVLLLTLIYPFVNMGRVTFYNNYKILYLGILLITLLLFSILYPFLHNTNDYSVAYKYLIILVEALYGAYLLYVLFLKEYSFDDVLHFVIVITFIQAMIVNVMFISESFGVFAVCFFQYPISVFHHIFRIIVMHHFRCQIVDPGMIMTVVIIIKELPAEASCILNRTEPFGELGAVF